MSGPWCGIDHGTPTQRDRPPSGARGMKGGLVMSGAKRVAALCSLTMLLACAAPARAAAQGSWSRPVVGAVALAYGARWTDASGRSCTHGGLDLMAPAGASVKACGPGEVVFAGLVPAGEGARAYAVTVLTADGLRVTYLPLSSVGVRKGDTVSAGVPIGSLAASGDGSSAETHLHLGVKRGDAALDPGAFLAPVANATPTIQTPDPVPTPVPHAPGVRTTPSPAPRTAPAPARQDSTVPQMSLASSAVPLPTAAQATRSAVQAAASALSLVDPIARVEPVSAPAVFDADRAGADIDASRALLLGVGLRIGLLLLAGACVIPVLRAATRAAAEPATVAARRDLP